MGLFDQEPGCDQKEEGQKCELCLFQPHWLAKGKWFVWKVKDDKSSFPWVFVHMIKSTSLKASSATWERMTTWSKGRSIALMAALKLSVSDTHSISHSMQIITTQLRSWSKYRSYRLHWRHQMDWTWESVESVDNIGASSEKPQYGLHSGRKVPHVLFWLLQFFHKACEKPLASLHIPNPSRCRFLTFLKVNF